MDSLNELQSAFPSCGIYVAELKRLRAAIETVPLVEFFEPKVAISWEKDAPGEELARR
jgi:hypothetical protein